MVPFNEGFVGFADVGDYFEEGFHGVFDGEVVLLRVQGVHGLVLELHVGELGLEGVVAGAEVLEGGFCGHFECETNISRIEKSGIVRATETENGSLELRVEFD